MCSGTTYSFVGAANKIPTAILGHLFFSSGLTAFGWAGIVIGLASGLSYAISTSQIASGISNGKPQTLLPTSQASPGGDSSTNHTKDAAV